MRRDLMMITNGTFKDIKALTCHFLTSDLSLSVVMSMPWKLVRQFLPWTSSTMSLNFLKATSSFCRSASDASNTRPLRPSEAISAERRNDLKRPLSFQTKPCDFSKHLAETNFTTIMYYTTQITCLH